MRIGFLIIAIGMVACSSNPSQSTGGTGKTAQAKEGDPGVICTYERPTDSYFREKKCTTPEQRELARREAESLDIRNSRDSGIN